MHCQQNYGPKSGLDTIDLWSQFLTLSQPFRVINHNQPTFLSTLIDFVLTVSKHIYKSMNPLTYYNILSETFLSLEQ